MSKTIADQINEYFGRLRAAREALQTDSLLYGNGRDMPSDVAHAYPVYRLYLRGIGIAQRDRERSLRDWLRWIGVRNADELRLQRMEEITGIEPEAEFARQAVRAGTQPAVPRRRGRTGGE